MDQADGDSDSPFFTNEQAIPIKKLMNKLCFGLGGVNWFGQASRVPLLSLRARPMPVPVGVTRPGRPF